MQFETSSLLSETNRANLPWIST
ncbi:hypothetical protein VCHC44C1_3331A, partial [Vibrio cholerae HC-44C1]